MSADGTELRPAGLRLRRWAAPLAVLSLALAAHGNGLANGFVWDDEQIVVGNPDTRDLSALGRVLLSADETASYYRPLTRASFLVDYRLWAMSPRGFHAVQIALHVANALLLLALGARLAGPAAGFLAAALLAVHPIHVESVAFVSARNNLLVALLGLAALLLLPGAARPASRLRAWGSGLAFLLALLSKEQAAGLLPALIALALFPDGLRRPGPDRFRILVPHAAAVVAYAVLRLAALGGAGAVAAAGGSWSGLPGRLALLAWSIPFYLGLLLFPLDLSVFHRVPASPLAAPWLVPAWLAIAAVSWLALRRGGPAAVGLLVAVGTFLPVANLVPIPSAPVAERYLYVPAAGLWLAVGGTLGGVLRPGPWRRPAIGAVAVVLCVLGVRAVARTADWRDDVTLFSSATAADPRSADARFNLGVALRDRGDLAGARREWEAALRCDPADGRSMAQLGTMAARAGDLTQAEALFRRSLAAKHADALTHFNLARVLDLSGRGPEALVHYRTFVAAPAERSERQQVAFAVRRIDEIENAQSR